MKKKTLLSVIATSVLATLCVAGAVYAGTITYNDELVVNNTGRFDSVYIGKQGTGGVTFFNGTIVNSTKNDGVDNPVTFGDNVRIDGEIWRGEQSGPYAGAEEDDMPVKVNDDLKVLGNTTIDGTLSNPTVDAKANSADVYGKSEVYTKTETDSALAGKANTGTSYTKSETDAALAGKANSSDLGNYVSKASPSWDTRTGYASISAYSFGPWKQNPSGTGDQEYQITTTGLVNFVDTGSNYYYAPIEIPHNVVMTVFEFWYSDSSANTLTARLFEHVHSLNQFNTLATLTSVNGSNTNATGFDIESRDDASYFVQYDFGTHTGANLEGRGAKVTYTYTQPQN